MIRGGAYICTASDVSCSVIDFRDDGLGAGKVRESVETENRKLTETAISWHQQPNAARYFVAEYVTPLMSAGQSLVTLPVLTDEIGHCKCKKRQLDETGDCEGAKTGRT